MEAKQYADQYEIHFLLGEGGQANVYLGSKNSELFALKVYLPGSGKQAAFKVEADFLSKLNFKHLINMVDHRLEAKVKIGNKPEEKRSLIVLQLAEGGQLFDFLSKAGRFTPEVCRVYFKQILQAIKYLVSVNVAHRDLKPENILFDREFTLKVSDFGLSRDARGNNNDYKLTSRVGTQGYKPPEMEQGNYTGLAADLFAAGVILFIMFNGTPPFLSTKSNDRIYQLIKTKNFPKFWQLHEKNKPPGHFPDPFKRLINSLLSSEIDRRPKLEDIQADEWICGDEIMNDDLIKYMSAKAEKMSQNDPNKKKLADLRDQLLKRAMQEEECEGFGTRGQDDEDQEADLQLTAQDYFAKNYKKLNIKTQSLPQYENKNLVYLQQKPGFVVAWLQNHLRDQLLNKEIFLTDFPSEIQPHSFKIDYDEAKNQLDAKFVFLIDQQDETELKLNGQLHRSSKNEVSVDWHHVEGAPFWLTSIQSSLNESLRLIA